MGHVSSFDSCSSGVEGNETVNGLVTSAQSREAYSNVICKFSAPLLQQYYSAPEASRLALVRFVAVTFFA